MRIYRFEIPMVAQGKGRGRAIRRGTTVRVVTPSKTRTYEATVADLARRAIGSLLMEGKIGLRILAVLPRSKAMSAVYKKTGKPKYSPDWMWADTARVDADNIAKAIMDGMTKAGIWKDDKQVCRLEVHKVLAEMVSTEDGWRQAAPRVIVQVTEYSEPGVAYYQLPGWAGSQSQEKAVQG